MNEQNSLALIISLFKKIREETDLKISNIREQVGPRGPAGERGAKGDKGDKGIKGDRGDVGPQGPQGPRGDKGETGPRGEKGDQGEVGPHGEKGLTGDRGEKGDVGEKGEKGDRGETGPVGPKGSKGDKGEKGDRGETGPQGPRGEKGDRGETGSKGDQGDAGAQGPAGPQGPKGEKGDQGIQGERGPKGDKGDKGDRGEKGEKGDPGETPDVTPLIQKAQDDFNNWRNQVNKSLASVGGGGSYKLLDNADVEYKKLSNVEEDGILIYYPDKKKFVVENFNSIVERLKVGVETQYNRLIDVEGSFTYVGEAVPGSETGSPVWRIKRIEEVGDDFNILWAEGSAEFDKIWDNRLSFTYS